MADKKTSAAKSLADAPFARRLRLPTRAIVTRSEMSPLEAARLGDKGELEIEALEGGLALLEMGGIAIAEGRIIKRRGSSFFRVERLFGAESKEGRK